ncbi:MAG: DUF5615 family PIN-like protein [Burkholderiales bacterium]
MRILIDMNLSPRWVASLRAAGWEAEHWSTIGPTHATDAEIMAWARAQRYIVLTHDLDFSAILAATQAKSPSVVQIRAQNVLPEDMAGLLIPALRQLASRLDQGALVTIEPARTRMRILPLDS